MSAQPNIVAIAAHQIIGHSADYRRSVIRVGPKLCHFLKSSLSYFLSAFFTCAVGAITFVNSVPFVVSGEFRVTYQQCETVH